MSTFFHNWLVGRPRSSESNNQDSDIQDLRNQLESLQAVNAILEEKLSIEKEKVTLLEANLELQATEAIKLSESYKRESAVYKVFYENYDKQTSEFNEIQEKNRKLEEDLKALTKAHTSLKEEIVDFTLTLQEKYKIVEPCNESLVIPEDTGEFQG